MKFKFDPIKKLFVKFENGLSQVCPEKDYLFEKNFNQKSIVTYQKDVEIKACITEIGRDNILKLFEINNEIQEKIKSEYEFEQKVLTIPGFPNHPYTQCKAFEHNPFGVNFSHSYYIKTKDGALIPSYPWTSIMEPDISNHLYEQGRAYDTTFIVPGKANDNFIQNYKNDERIVEIFTNIGISETNISEIGNTIYKFHNAHTALSLALFNEQVIAFQSSKGIISANKTLLLQKKDEMLINNILNKHNLKIDTTILSKKFKSMDIALFMKSDPEPILSILNDF